MITLLLFLVAGFLAAAALFWQMPFGPLLAISLFVLFGININLLLGLLFQTFSFKQLKKICTFLGMTSIFFLVGVGADFFFLTKLVTPQIALGALWLLLSSLVLALGILFFIAYSHRIKWWLRVLLKFIFIITSAAIGIIPLLFIQNNAFPL